jgi:hypothetical protein
MSRKRPEIGKEYMEILRPCLHFHGIQIKSEDTFRRFAMHLENIEVLVGIHSVTISLEDIFVCPEINFSGIEAPTAMEKLLIGLIESLECRGRDK